MIVKDSQGLIVEVLQVEGEYNDGARVTDACYMVDGKELTDFEIAYLNETYQEEIYAFWYEDMVGSSEYVYEGER